MPDESPLLYSAFIALHGIPYLSKFMCGNGKSWTIHWSDAMPIPGGQPPRLSQHGHAARRDLVVKFGGAGYEMCEAVVTAKV